MNNNPIQTNTRILSSWKVRPPIIANAIQAVHKNGSPVSGCKDGPWQFHSNRPCDRLENHSPMPGTVVKKFGAGIPAPSFDLVLFLLGLPYTMGPDTLAGAA